MFRRRQSVATPTEQPHGPATWARQPRELAHNDANALAGIAGIAMLGITVAASAIMLVVPRQNMPADQVVMLWMVGATFVTVLWLVAGRQRFSVLWLLAAIGGWTLAVIATWIVLTVEFSLYWVLAAICTCAVMTGILWLVVYAVELYVMNGKAKNATWVGMFENVTGSDLDGDGEIGRRTIDFQPLSGKKQVIEVDWDRDKDPFVKGFELGAKAKDRMRASEVVEFVEWAQSRGLQDRVLQGTILRSGRKLSQQDVRKIQHALAAKGMAEQIKGRWVLKVTPQQVAEEASLEASRYVALRQNAGVTQGDAAAR